MTLNLAAGYWKVGAALVPKMAPGRRGICRPRKSAVPKSSTSTHRYPIIMAATRIGLALIMLLLAVQVRTFSPDRIVFAEEDAAVLLAVVLQRSGGA